MHVLLVAWLALLPDVQPPGASFASDGLYPRVRPRVPSRFLRTQRHPILAIGIPPLSGESVQVVPNLEPERLH